MELCGTSFCGIMLLYFGKPGGSWRVFGAGLMLTATGKWCKISVQNEKHFNSTLLSTNGDVTQRRRRVSMRN